MSDADAILDVELTREAERIIPPRPIDERLIFNGVQARLGKDAFGVFTDPETGTTFCVTIGGDVMAALAAKRKQFGRKESR